jgi:hypothetical protein
VSENEKGSLIASMLPISIRMNEEEIVGEEEANDI